MTDIHILRPSKETDKDKLSIAEAKKKLKPCPICGSKAYISKDIVDGFYFGWSVGCPRFCLNDGIHGIDENTPIEKHLSIMNLDSANECVEKWNRRVDEYSESEEYEDKRACEKCIHYVTRDSRGVVLCGCDSWECEFEEVKK